MYGNIEDLFNLLLEDPNMGYDSQKRLYEYGFESKDYDLLTKLALHSNLDNSIDLLLSKIDAVSVRAAWVAKPGRSTEEILAMVSKEKRINVLTNLLSNPDIPEDIFKKVLQGTVSKKFAYTVFDNEALSSSLRLLASQKILDLEKAARKATLKDPNFDGFDFGFTRICENILSKTPTILPILKTDNSLEAQVSIAAYSEIDLATFIFAQKIFTEKASHLVKATSELKKSGETSYYVKTDLANRKSNLIRGFTFYIEEIVKSTPFSKELDSEIKTLFSAIEKITDTHYEKSEVTECKKLLASWKKSPVQLFFQDLERLDTTKEMDEIVNQITFALDNDSQIFSNGTRIRLANLILASELTSLESIKKVASWLTWHDDSILAMKEIGVEKTEKCVSFLLGLDFYDVDKYLAVLKDPQLALSLLINGHVKTENLSRYSDISTFLRSDYLTYEVARTVPLNALLETKIASISENLIKDLNETFVEDKQWANFKTLAPEFNGSLSQLLELCKSL